MVIMVIKTKVTVIAERETDILNIMEKNRQDHIVQLLNLGYDSVTVIFEKNECIEPTDSKKTSSISYEKETL